MRKGALPYLLFFAFTCTLLLQACKNDSYLLDPPPIKDQSFVEEFDTMQQAYNRGWRWINRSVPIGVTNWMAAPGPDGFMEAYSSRGTNTGAAFSDYQATSGTDDGVISNWLVSPAVVLQNDDKIVFYTKTQLTSTSGTGRDFGCRLQVCLNKQDADLSMGNGNDPGKFNTVLLDINPDEEEYLVGDPSTHTQAYPGNWTRFEATISGLAAPVKGRFAFRYFLHDAGSNGAGNGVGIDSVAYISHKH